MLEVLAQFQDKEYSMIKHRGDGAQYHIPITHH
jgi:hypothetical protein